jgi:DNA-binding protein H-NS
VNVETLSEQADRSKRETEAFLKKKKAAKPVADRHRPEFNDPILVTSDDILDAVSTMDDADLVAHHARVTEIVASRREQRLAKLQAEAAALGAIVKMPGARKGEAVPPKYRGPNGETWAGRGVLPVWLRDLIEEGHTMEEFAVR